nr:hypothetical protein [Bradyrhizobium sp. AUGA SZCCT0182]
MSSRPYIKKEFTLFIDRYIIVYDDVEVVADHRALSGSAGAL